MDGEAAKEYGLIDHVLYSDSALKEVEEEAEKKESE